jgi:transposase
VFGKRVLIIDREDWPVAEVVAGYRSQSDAEFSFSQLKDRHVVSYAPMHHWTDHTIRVHLFARVPGLQLAHLMRREARRGGLRLSVRELLSQLAGIEESVLIYPSAGGRPTVRCMLTATAPEQHQLAAIFHLDRWAPQT